MNCSLSEFHGEINTLSLSYILGIKPRKSSRRSEKTHPRGQRRRKYLYTGKFPKIFSFFFLNKRDKILNVLSVTFVKFQKHIPSFKSLIEKVCQGKSDPRLKTFGANPQTPLVSIKNFKDRLRTKSALDLRRLNIFSEQGCHCFHIRWCYIWRIFSYL